MHYRIEKICCDLLISRLNPITINCTNCLQRTEGVRMICRRSSGLNRYSIQTSLWNNVGAAIRAISEFYMILNSIFGLVRNPNHFRNKFCVCFGHNGTYCLANIKLIYVHLIRLSKHRKQWQKSKLKRGRLRARESQTSVGA